MKLNIFNRNPTNTPIHINVSYREGPITSSASTRRTILTTIVNRIALDVSSTQFHHIRTDGDQNTELVIDSGLENCLNLEANIDQTSQAFIQDLIFTMMDKGVCAIVPTDFDDRYGTLGEYKSVSEGAKITAFNIETIRVGTVQEWAPRTVKLEVYNELIGDKQDLVMNKNEVGILYNPFYEVMNTGNSTLSRLTHKLALIDKIDNAQSPDKLNMILQLPFPVKTDAQKKIAKDRVDNLIKQIQENPYGIAYVDATEKITQLSGQVANSLIQEVENLRNELFNQLGMTKSIFDGTATEQELKTYYKRTITPIVRALTLELNRKFLTKTARSQGHKFTFHEDMFALVPFEQLATTLSVLKQSTMITTNEGRAILGLKVSEDPLADILFNPNISDPNALPMDMGAEMLPEGEVPPEGEDTPVMDEETYNKLINGEGEEG